MSTKDSLYMEGKNLPLCPLCEYGIYDAINEKGFNCNKRESAHFTRMWDVPVESVITCDCFHFAVPVAKKWVESEVEKREKKAQTTLGDF